MSRTGLLSIRLSPHMYRRPILNNSTAGPLANCLVYKLILFPFRFQNRLGCHRIDLTNTSNLYPRFLKSTICSSLVQASISACNLTSATSRPLCADSCVRTLCGTRSSAFTNTYLGRICRERGLHFGRQRPVLQQLLGCTAINTSGLYNLRTPRRLPFYGTVHHR